MYRAHFLLQLRRADARAQGTQIEDGLACRDRDFCDP
jgi:hypothetical protein